MDYCGRTIMYSAKSILPLPSSSKMSNIRCERLQACGQYTVLYCTVLTVLYCTVLYHADLRTIQLPRHGCEQLPAQGTLGAHPHEAVILPCDLFFTVTYKYELCITANRPSDDMRCCLAS